MIYILTDYHKAALGSILYSVGERIFMPWFLAGVAH